MALYTVTGTAEASISRACVAGIVVHAPGPASIELNGVLVVSPPSLAGLLTWSRTNRSKFCSCQYRKYKEMPTLTFPSPSNMGWDEVLCEISYGTRIEWVHCAHSMFSRLAEMFEQSGLVAWCRQHSWTTDAPMCKFVRCLQIAYPD